LIKQNLKKAGEASRHREKSNALMVSERI